MEELRGSFTIEEPIAVRRDYTSTKPKVEIFPNIGKVCQDHIRPQNFLPMEKVPRKGSS